MIFYHATFCKLTRSSSSLKTEYVAHLKMLGSTGVGLDPLTITKGSSIANVIGAYQLHCYVD